MMLGLVDLGGTLSYSRGAEVGFVSIVTAVSGLVLIAMGVLLLTGELTRLNGEAQQALDSIGLNVFKDL